MLLFAVIVGIIVGLAVGMLWLKNLDSLFINVVFGLAGSIAGLYKFLGGLAKAG